MPKLDAIDTLRGAVERLKRIVNDPNTQAYEAVSASHALRDIADWLARGPTDHVLHIPDAQMRQLRPRVITVRARDH